MTELWTAAAIAQATGGTAAGDFAVTGVSFDSREVVRGDLFVAMPGEATDGHRFVDPAFAAGAAGAIVAQPIARPHVLVPDVAAALNDLAVAARARTAARVIGVTGSVGKTGTKGALAEALARTPGTRVHRSVKSYNNHTGVPLSLARMPADTQFAVFEMGMNHAGEIAALTRLVRPHSAIVTAIAPAHIENFADEAGIADAKSELFEGLEPGGTAIVPFDSPHRDRLTAAARRAGARVVTFGCGEGADVRAIDRVALAHGTLVSARLVDAELGFTVAQAGDHWVSNALAVLAAVEAVGGDLAAAGLALADLTGLPGRGARHRIALADGHATIIDESYNANAASMAATLAVLGATPATRRIAVLGEMRELGAASAALHAGLAPAIIASDVAQVVLVGEAMAPLAAALEGRVELRHVADAAQVRAMLQLGDGDVVLVKGSNAVGLGAVVAALVDRGM